MLRCSMEETFCSVTEKERGRMKREEEEERKVSVWVDEEAREGAVFVGVSPVNFAAVQLHTHFVANVQVQDDAVGGVVVVLVGVLSDGAGPHLAQRQETHFSTRNTDLIPLWGFKLEPSLFYQTTEPKVCAKFDFSNFRVKVLGYPVSDNAKLNVFSVWTNHCF